MNIVKIIAVAIVTVVTSIVVKQTKPEISVLINIAGGILLVILVVDLLGQVFANFYNIFQTTGIDNDLLLPILKIIGVGYLCEFGANIKAIDISENQILAAKDLAKERNIENIEFSVSGAEKTHFADNSFDCITAAQCFWYFDRENAIN